MVRLQEETEFLCLFSAFVLFLPGTLWITPAGRTDLRRELQTVVNPRHNLYNNTKPIASFQQDPTILSHTLVRHTDAEFLCFCFLFCFFTGTIPPLKRAQPGSAWMARNRCHASTMALRERQRLELAVTLNLTSNRKTRVSRIFQPSKRSGSVRKPSFSVYYFVSLSHLSTLSPSWLGTDWWRRTH